MAASPSDYLDSMFLMFLLLVSFTIAIVIHTFKIQVLHESGAAIILGAVIGVITNQFGEKGEHLHDVGSFNPDIFFFFLLPPIIFESGLNMKTRHFFSNFGAIMLFAVLGTLISTAVVGSAMWLLGRSGVVFQLSMVENFLFAALISAVDPVTVLAIFKSLGADPTLDSIVFGESVLNDAVAIVLFRTLADFVDMPLTGESVGLAIWLFIKIFGGSFLIGIAVGFASALFFKHTKLKDHSHFEIPVSAIFAYAPYFVAEACSLSGIVAVLFGGVIMSHYTLYSMSKQNQKVAPIFFHAIACVAETCIFLFLGMDILNRELFPFFEWPYIILSVLACFLGRALNIFPLSVILNLFRKSEDRAITMNQQVMMWWAGLRGAIAFALCLRLPASIPTQHSQIIITTTLFIIAFTVLICGGTSPFLVKKLDLLDPQALANHEQYDPLIDQTASTARPEFYCPKHRDQCLHGRWRNLDDNYIKKIFGGKEHAPTKNLSHGRLTQRLLEDPIAE